MICESSNDTRKRCLVGISTWRGWGTACFVFGVIYDCFLSLSLCVCVFANWDVLMTGAQIEIFVGR